MTTTAQDFNGPMPTMQPSVVVGGGAALPAEVSSRIIRVVVDTDLHLPGMFEVSFLDYDGQTLSSAGLAIGSLLEVWGNPLGGMTSQQLIAGEVTSIEGALHGMRVITTVRGYTTAHRLQRARRTQTFLDSTDSEIAEEIALAAGLEALIEPTVTVHGYLAQVNQTDWEFLVYRAAEIGYEVGVTNGILYFRPASTVDSPAFLEPVTVTFPDSLMMFCPRVSAGNQPSGIEVRVWDPLAAQATAVSGTATNGSLAATGLSGLTVTPATVGAEFTPFSVNVPDPLAVAPTLQYLGPEPSPTAYVVNDRPVATGMGVELAGAAVAAGVAKHLGTTFAEAEGEALGNPAIQPGAAVEVAGVQAQFAGRWLVTHARHIFDASEHGYRTSFSAHGLNDRSVLGLTTSNRPIRPTIEGVVCGIVSNCNDLFGKGRVKVVLPWLSPTFETDWAPVVQFGTGQRTGSMFLPEVGDEVLLAFEQADPRRPYVLGGIVNNYSTWSLGGPAVQPLGLTGSVVRRGFVSSAGNALIFNDEVLPAPAVGPPITSSIRLGAAPGGLAAVAADIGAADPAAAAAGGEAAAVDEDADAAEEDASAAEGDAAAAEGEMGGAGAGAGAGAGLGLSALQPGALLSLDQVACNASLTCNPMPGVTTLPTGSLTIGATDGAITITTGPGPIGSVVVDGGASLTLSALAIKIQALESVQITAPMIELN